MSSSPFGLKLMVRSDADGYEETLSYPCHDAKFVSHGKGDNVGAAKR